MKRVLLQPAIRSVLIPVVLAACVVSLAWAQTQEVATETAFGSRPITPAGSVVLDATTGMPAVGSMPVNFVRSPDHAAKDGGGRYLIAVNSGYGIQFSAAGNRAQQSLAVIDLEAQPAAQVIEDVYFPTPQSANVGAVFSPQPPPTVPTLSTCRAGSRTKSGYSASIRTRPSRSRPPPPAPIRRLPRLRFH